ASVLSFSGPLTLTAAVGLATTQNLLQPSKKRVRWLESFKPVDDVTIGVHKERKRDRMHAVEPTDIRLRIQVHGDERNLRQERGHLWAPQRLVLQSSAGRAPSGPEVDHDRFSF